MKYICNDIFMVRNTNIPIEIYFDLQKIENLNNILDFIDKKNILDFTKEAIIISSQSLFYSLENLGRSNKKDYAIYTSLYKYLIRATTRPTPFGILSSVMLGKFCSNNKSNYVFRIKNKRKIDVKVDMYWLCGVIHSLENDYDVLSKIDVKWNKLCYISGKRLKNPYFANHGIYHDVSDLPVEKIDINYTPLIKLIMDETDEYISFEKLKDKIMCKYPLVPEETVFGTLKLLIDNEIIFTELRIPTYCKDSLKYVIDVLTKKDAKFEIFSLLKEIHSKLALYKKNNVSNYQLLNEIYQSMGKIYKSNHYLKVDLAKDNKNMTLPIDIKKKLENFVDKFSNIYIETNKYSNLKSFKKKFVEKYGHNISVPLFEIIDENKFNGLKYIEKKSSSKSNMESDRENIIRSIFENKIQAALINGEKNIDLTIKDFSSVLDNNKITNLVSSFDLNIIITKTKDENIHYTIGPNQGSPLKVGNSFQRFNGLFDKELFKAYSTVYDLEKKQLENKYLLVEAIELEKNARANNLTNENKNYDYYIAVGKTTFKNENEIFLKDLALVITETNKLLIIHTPNKRICKIIADDMLNSNANSKLLYFLKEVSKEYDDGLILDRLGYLFTNQYTFRPRINFEGITISPKRWIFSKNQLNLDSFGAFQKSFNDLISTFCTDKLVYLTNGDNRLILNLKFDKCLEIIYKEIKKQKSIVLTELEEGLLDGFVTQDYESNHYITEIILSFIKQQEENEYKNIEYLFSKNYQVLEDKRRIFTPFEEGWVYIKLYGLGDKENIFLRELPDLIDRINNTNYFFIRYADESGKHLRIRIKFNNESDALKNLCTINDWFRKFKNNGYIDEWTFNQYERESNRYGGNIFINKIESIFYLDSQYIIALLGIFDTLNDDDKVKIGFLSLSYLLRFLTNNRENAYDLLNKHWTNKNYRKQFNANRVWFVNCMEKIYNDDLLSDDLLSYFPNNDKINNIFKQRNIIALEIGKKLNTESPINKNGIILSLLHMFCNRLIRDGGEYEHKIHSIMRHTLFALLEKERNKEGNLEKFN